VDETRTHGVDDVPRGAEDGGAETKTTARNKNAVTLTQPGLGHAMKLLKDIECNSFVTSRIGSWQRRLVQIIHDVAVCGMLAAIMMDKTARPWGAAAEFKLHCLAPHSNQLTILIQFYSLAVSALSQPQHD
jgi:hypothetical protein